eukprot:gene2287-1429_t
MDPLITTVNDLQDAFANIKSSAQLKLPQIAVVGSQSCGKSSVLESIVGRDFLPRGSGIVTRCPLVLQLIQLKPTEKSEWGEFLHLPGKKFTDFSEIRDEISRRTDEIAGKHAISDQAIHLKLFSAHVLTLTLIDLPGLVMNAVGDQPKDIDVMIKRMVMKYVQDPTTIILAISPANTDLATSQSLRLASQLDPEGKRTVGVLTKLDLMDRGTDCMDVLSNKLFPLRHGYVGVVCRSQQDIVDRTSMEDARRVEREFFERSDAYRSIADQSGTEYLSRKLNILLMEHIRANLPALKGTVESMWVDTQKKMEQLGMLDDANYDPGAQLLKIIKDFSDAVNKIIDGGVAEATKEIMGGARLSYIFHECFASFVFSVDAARGLTDDYIRINAHNMAGMHATLFPSDNVFIALVKAQIKRLEDPSLRCIEFILQELQSILEQCSKKADRFPKLKAEIIRICREMLMQYKRVASEHVKTIVQAEHGFINARHPMMEKLAQEAYFKMYGGKAPTKESDQKLQAEEVKSEEDDKEDKDDKDKKDKKKDKDKDKDKDKKKGKEEEAEGKKKSSSKGGIIDGLANQSTMDDVPSRILLGNSMSSNEKRTYEAIRLMVIGYFDIVKGNVADQVPKAITLLIITRLREEMYSSLVRHLYSEKAAQELLAEPPHIMQQRKEAKEMKEALAKAREKLNEVSSFMPNL